tara:strand:- start:1155 stop:1322 length:168 start_codon:yes stop_codon:yes gene_type:complete
MAGHKPMEKKKRMGMMYGGSRKGMMYGGMGMKKKKRNAMNAGGMVMASMENQKPN